MWVRFGPGPGFTEGQDRPGNLPISISAPPAGNKTGFWVSVRGQGRWPEGLAEMVAGFLQRIPLRMAGLVGNQVRARRTESFRPCYAGLFSLLEWYLRYTVCCSYPCQSRTQTMQRKLAIAICGVFLITGLIRLGVSAIVISELNGWWQVGGEAAVAVADTQRFIAEADANLVGFTPLSYFTFLGFMGVIVSLGAIREFWRKSWGLSMIGLYLCRHAFLFFNFMTVNPKVGLLGLAWNYGENARYGHLAGAARLSIRHRQEARFRDGGVVDEFHAKTG